MQISSTSEWPASNKLFSFVTQQGRLGQRNGSSICRDDDAYGADDGGELIWLRNYSN